MPGQRAAILADAVELFAWHPTIDPERIGVWGISQAGYVMPLALEKAMTYQEYLGNIEPLHEDPILKELSVLGEIRPEDEWSPVGIYGLRTGWPGKAQACLWPGRFKAPRVCPARDGHL